MCERVNQIAHCPSERQILILIGLDVRLKFQTSYDDSAIERPVLKVPVKDRPEQLSYVLQFTTYHRPYKQTGPGKSQAMPLNA